MNTVVIIQARTGSSRFPEKVLEIIKEKPLLIHVIERVKLSHQIDNVVIATTTKKSDDKIVALCNLNNIDCFRGSEDNVLERYYQAARQHDATRVVRITSDCPLIDPNILDEMLILSDQNPQSIVYNGGNELDKRTFPRGLDVEIFPFEYLESAYLNAKEQYQKEHVTPFIYENNEKLMYKSQENNSDLRWTVDTEEDMRLVKTIYDYLYKGEHNFFYKEIFDLVQKHPELKEINCNIKQKKLKG